VPQCLFAGFFAFQVCFGRGVPAGKDAIEPRGDIKIFFTWRGQSLALIAHARWAK
jgi:hypothetical protein